MYGLMTAAREGMLSVIQYYTTRQSSKLNICSKRMHYNYWYVFNLKIREIIVKVDLLFWMMQRVKTMEWIFYAVFQHFGGERITLLFYWVLRCLTLFFEGGGERLMLKTTCSTKYFFIGRWWDKKLFFGLS